MSRQEEQSVKCIYSNVSAYHENLIETNRKIFNNSLLIISKYLVVVSQHSKTHRFATVFGSADSASFK